LRPTRTSQIAEGPARRRRRVDGVEANARLTGSSAAVLLVLLAAEGLTIPFIHRLLTPHVVIGMVLVPPVLVKIGSTGYRFARYYGGRAAYVKKGPPPVLLRLLAPFVVVLTLVLFWSGIALMFSVGQWRSDLQFLHKASFVLWFGAMTIHVLAHLGDTARLAPRDWYGRARREITGTGARQWLLLASIAVGVLLGVLLAARVGTFLSDGSLSGSGAPALVTDCQGATARSPCARSSQSASFGHTSTASRAAPSSS
jgi:hypothetical protein